MKQERVRIGVPVRNRQRAIAFYSALLGIELDEREASILLTFEEQEEPAALIHFRIHSLERALEVVWSNGGTVLEPELLDAPPVRKILVLDSEGNRLALSAE
jgi:predicted enzyme related to lactoylglutathione lyase